MTMEYINTTVIENVEICNEIYSLWVKHKEGVRAGQFYMLKGQRAFLGRPISVCEVEHDKVRFLYAVVGEGTRELKELKEGDPLKLIGPLGNGFDTNKEYKRVALVGGGIGIAPMLEVAKNLSGKVQKLDLYAGFREDVYLTSEIEKYTESSYITTEYETSYEKGFVTLPLLRNIKEYDTVLCCGPEVMMKSVVEICRENGVEVYVSMEKHMACGVGACLVCTCKTKEGNKRTCKDGPVFNGLDIEF